MVETFELIIGEPVSKLINSDRVLSIVSFTDKDGNEYVLDKTYYLRDLSEENDEENLKQCLLNFNKNVFGEEELLIDVRCDKASEITVAVSDQIAKVKLQMSFVVNAG